MDEVIRVRRGSPEFDLVCRIRFLQAVGEDFAISFNEVNQDLLEKVGYKFEKCTMPVWDYNTQEETEKEVTKVTW